MHIIPILLAASTLTCSTLAHGRELLPGLPSYVEMNGDDAKAMIVGNTVKTTLGDGITYEYYPNEKASYFFGSGSPETTTQCTISSGTVTSAEIRSQNHVFPYRVFKPVSVSPKKAARGTLIGFVFHVGPYVGQTAKDAYTEILKGNPSACPEMSPVAKAEPLEISRAEWEAGYSGSGDDPASAAARNRFIVRMFISNTLMRLDKRGDNTCQGDDPYASDGYYFSHDGRYAYYNCVTPGTGIEGPDIHGVGTDHWKIISGQLCLHRPQPDDLHRFDSCHAFALHAIAIEGDDQHVRIGVVDKENRGTPPGDRPYVIMKGNPMTFGWSGSGK